MTKMATMTSCWRRDIAMLLDTLRPSEGSDLAIKVVMMMVMEVIEDDDIVVDDVCMFV